MRRALKVVAIVLAVGLIPLTVGTGLFLDRERDRAGLDQELAVLARVEAEALESAFERGRAINLLLAHSPVIPDFYAAPGTTGAKSTVAETPLSAPTRPSTTSGVSSRWRSARRASSTGADVRSPASSVELPRDRRS